MKFWSLLLFVFSTSSLFAQSIILIENDTDRRILNRRVAVDSTIIEPTPTPPKNLKIKSHLVTINVTDQVAVTEIDQIFYNPFSRQMEGHYLFPLPADANVNKFSMWMNGKEVHAEILESAQATQIYQSIVSRRRDPGLLELVGTQLLKVHVFPIPAKSDTRIKLSYTNTLKKDSGMMELSYPINTSKFVNYPVDQCSILVKVKNQRGLTTVYSPTHNMDLNKKSDHEVIGSWEKAKHLAIQPFKLYITESDKEFGIHGLTHRLPGEEGYFMMMVSPKQESVQEIPKDVVFVVDTSGSMAGAKITQTKAALSYCISKLKAEDRFNIVPFSTEARLFADNLQEGNAANLKRAQHYVSKLLPRGGTNIDEALQMGLEMFDKDRLSIILFLTDGVPTIGERNVKTILKNVKSGNKSKTSIFAFGAGNEINTELLDKLASQNHGTQEYVAENEDIKVKIARFFDKLSSPVMTDVRFNFVGFRPTDVYPKQLPDMFKGSQLLVTGRYNTSGTKAIQLIGTLQGKTVTLTDEVNFQAEKLENDFVPRIWANRKVGYLMEEIRTHGVNKELKQEIIRLGKKFGIVTPYTSFLAVEESELSSLPPGVLQRIRQGGGSSGGDRGMNAPEPAGPEDSASRRPREENLKGLKLDEADFEKAKEGKKAVKQSRAASKRKTTANLEDALQAFADSVETGDDDENQKDKVERLRKQLNTAIKTIGAKTFINAGNIWIDRSLPANKKDELIKIKAFSKEYFELMKKNSGIAKYLSVGKNIVLAYKGKYYYIHTK